MQVSSNTNAISNNFLTKDKWNRLTFLKFLACSLIMIFHLDNSFNGIFSKNIPFLQNYGGYLGNYTFFILSGLAMDYCYKDKLIANKISFKSFIISKLLKIYPVYFISLFAYVCIGGPSSVNMKREMLSFLMIASGWVDDIYPENIVAWFFCVILLLYILFYFICYIQSKTTMNIYLPLFSVFIFLGYALTSLNLSIPFLYVHDGEGLMYFSIGICISQFMKSHTQKSIKIFSHLGLLILFLFSILCIKYGVNSVSGDTPFICGSFICVIVILWILNTDFMPWFFRKIAFIGKFSMEMCLLHLPLNHIFYNLQTTLKNNTVVWLIIYLTVLFIVCMLCHYLTQNLSKLLKTKYMI